MRKILSLIALLTFAAMPAFADTYVTVPNPTSVWDTTTHTLYAIGTPGNTSKTLIPSASTQNAWAGLNNFTGQFEASGTVLTQGIPFSTVAAGNPLMLQTAQSIPVASINAAGGYTFVAGATGRTIYPAGLIVTAVGGSASGATNVKVICTSGNVLGTFPIAGLINNAPVTPFSSTGAISSGTGFTGCASGDGVLISTVGSALATSTSLFVNMPYTVQ